MFLLIAGFTTGLALVINSLAEHLTAPIPIIGSFLSLKLTHNAGIAYGILLPQPLLIFLLVVAMAGLLTVAYREARQPLAKLAFGLIVGGAIANIIDRSMNGVVTDYIFVSFFPYIFNVADCAISVGVVLLLWQAVRKNKHRW